jgi:signal transduction histidine kinase
MPLPGPGEGYAHRLRGGSVTASEARTSTERLIADSVEASAEGFAVMDADGRCRYANPAARRLLAAHGQTEITTLLEDEPLHVTRWPFVSGEDNLLAYSFHEAERAERQHRRVAAFARTTARIACRGPLQEVMDRVAVEARNATGALACSIILFESDALRIALVGTAGHGADYPNRLMECVELGAPLASLDAYRTGRPSRRSRISETTVGDVRYRPMTAPIREGGWDEVVAVPAVVRGRSIGVLTSFFGRDELPTEDDITFLTALADQVVVAVENADLFEQLQAAAAAAERYELAIDLHDSVSQGLFSVIMQCRALSMRADSGGSAAMLDAIYRLESTAEETQREIRSLLRQMAPVDNPPRSLRDDLLVLHQQLIELTTGAEPRVELSLPRRVPVLVDADRRELVRVVREAATNSIRHAGASVVRIRLDHTGQELVMLVEDDGVGLDRAAPAPGHFGLESMARRAERLGARLEIDAGDDGTVVRLTLPLRALGSEVVR